MNTDYNLIPETWYHVECIRDGRVIWEEHFHNLVTAVGKNKVLDATFKTGIAAPAWYVGLVNNTSWVQYDATNTMAYPGIRTITITRSGTTATATSTAHRFVTGDYMTVAGADQTDYNIRAAVTRIDANTFTYTVANSPATPATGTITATSDWLEGTPYSDGTRKAFTAGTIASGSVDNSASKAVFSINATLTVRGAFLVDESTKSGATGTLYGVGDFSVARSVITGDTLNVTVTLSVS